MDSNQLLKRGIVIAFGVFIASGLFGGIRYDSIGVLVLAAVLLSACNVFLKPLLMLFSLPFIILTLGVGIWIINALLFLFVSKLVPGFYVDTFGSAMLGALIVSITSGVATVLFAKPGQRNVNVQFNRTAGGPPPPNSGAAPRASAPKAKPVSLDDDDVIDI